MCPSQGLNKQLILKKGKNEYYSEITKVIEKIKILCDNGQANFFNIEIFIFDTPYFGYFWLFLANFDCSACLFIKVSQAENDCYFSFHQQIEGKMTIK